MTAARDKDSSDFDLEQFIDLFDTALASDNPAVKRALKNLLMIATLVDSNIPAEERVRGPLRRLVDDIHNLHRRLSTLEQKHVVPQTWPNTTTGPYVVPSWPPTTTGTPFPPGTIIGTGTSGSSSAVSTTAFDDQYRVDGLLNKLESKL